MRMYGDESYSGFFRRLSFSPDGSLLVTPSGIFEAATPTSPNVAAASPSKSPAVLGGSQNNGPSNASSGPRSTVYLYGRANLTRGNAPIAHLPGHKSATLVVRFSPILYELRKSHTSAFSNSEDGGGIAPHTSIPLEAGKQKSVSLNLDPSMANTRNHASPSPAAGSSGGAGTTPSPIPPVKPVSMIGLPYRMVFAVATNDVVWLYDTQQGGPLCCFSNMHYAAFTDLTWSADGQTLIMSSSDGYCSIAVFDYGELGTPYSYQDQPSLDIKAFTGAGGHPQTSGTGSSSGAGASASGSGSATVTVTSLPVKKKPVLSTVPAASAPSSEGAAPHSQASTSSGGSASGSGTGKDVSLPARAPSRGSASEAGQGTSPGTGAGSSTAFALGIVLEGDQHHHPDFSGTTQDHKSSQAAAASETSGATEVDQDQDQPKKKRRIALQTSGAGAGAGVDAGASS